MSSTGGHRYYHGRWPDPVVPEGEPLWMLYEIAHAGDAVLRSVDIFEDGHITRNSVAIEQRHGDYCPSLIDMPVSAAFAGAPLEEITLEAFERACAEGVDTPFWFVR